jgi:hypothetical protein
MTSPGGWPVPLLVLSLIAFTSTKVQVLTPEELRVV